MKKSSSKKLTLNKSTLRNLSSNEASNVAGGAGGGLISFPAATCVTKLKTMCPTQGGQQSCDALCTVFCPIKQ